MTTADAPPASPLTRREVDALREQFPVLTRRIAGRPLAYLDNAATSQKPRRVIDAVSRYYERSNANVHRGVHTLSMEATDAYETARAAIARHIDAGDPHELLFVRGATEAINLVAQSFARPRLGPGDEVLVTQMEHHSNIVPWQLVCEQTGAALRGVPVTDSGEVDAEALARLLHERTKIVALVHISNAIGTINDIRHLTSLAKGAGAAVVVDGCQALPHTSVDVRDLGCDFYAFSGHKAYGPTGIGSLWGRPDLLDAMPPYQGGGEMIRSVSLERGTTFADIPQKFEAGTPNIAGAVGFGEAIEFLRDVGVERIAAHEHGLRAKLEDRLHEIDGLSIVGTAQRKAGIVSFTIEGVHPHDLGTVLDASGIAIRTGHHCTQPLMERFGLAATARASLACYNTEDEVNALADGVREAAGMLR